MGAYWDEQTEATASVVDSLNRLSYYFLTVNGNTPHEPDLYPRPGAVEAVPESVSLADFNAFLRE